MNWITNIVRPRIKGLMGGKDRGDTPDNLWRKCPSCGEMIFHRDLVAALNVCPQCGHHLRIGPAERFAYTFDPGSFTELAPPSVPADPLRFKGEKKYTDEIKAARTKTGRPEAFTAARGTLDGLSVMIGVQRRQVDLRHIHPGRGRPLVHEPEQLRADLGGDVLLRFDGAASDVGREDNIGQARQR